VLDSLGASKHLASLLTMTDNASGKLLIIFILSYLFVLPTSFCEFPKHIAALHYGYEMQMYCTFVLFVNQHFPGLPASGTHCITVATTYKSKAIPVTGSEGLL
jgi:hypothetical protein